MRKKITIKILEKIKKKKKKKKKNKNNATYSS